MEKIDLIIKVLKDWRETADKFGFDSLQAKKKGAIAMPLLFENRELLPESNQRFALRALEGRFTIDGIKTLNDGGYCDFYADKNFIADLASKRKKEAEQPAEPERGDEWIKVSEAAEILSVNTGTVTRWANKGRIKDNEKKGRKRRVLKSSVLFLKQSREDSEVLKDAKELRKDTRTIPDQH